MKYCKDDKKSVERYYHCDQDTPLISSATDTGRLGVKVLEVQISHLSKSMDGAMISFQDFDMRCIDMMEIEKEEFDVAFYRALSIIRSGYKE